MINDYIKKLRRAADVLEELLTSNPFGDVKAAKALGKKFENNLDGDKPVDGRKKRKGYRYNGAHWKQKRIAKAAAEAAAKAALDAPVKETPPPTVTSPIKKGFRYAPGQHWTQRPENRAHLEKILRKSVRTRKANKARRLNQPKT